MAADASDGIRFLFSILHTERAIMAKDKVTVRILVANDIDGKRYQPNDLVKVDAPLAKTLVKDGKADDSKESVEYVLSEGGMAIEHVKPVANAADETEKKEGDA
jgi:hypothetical protein